MLFKKTARQQCIRTSFHSFAILVSVICVSRSVICTVVVKLLGKQRFSVTIVNISNSLPGLVISVNNVNTGNT